MLTFFHRSLGIRTWEKSLKINYTKQDIYNLFLFDVIICGFYGRSLSKRTLLHSKKPLAETPIISNYFSILTGYSGISTIFHRLFYRGGHFTGRNLSAKSWPGELRARIGRIFPEVSGFGRREVYDNEWFRLRVT